MHTILITGSSGYVGEMLCDQLSKRDNVWKIIAIDKESQSDWGRTFSKVTYIQHNLADDGWQEQVAKYEPDIVIHAAWQIRELYGRQLAQKRWNITGSDKVFDFTFNQPSVKRLIYFSTAAVYSARSTNTFDHYFAENEELRVDNYSYAREKKISEEHLQEKFKQAKKEGKTSPRISVLRPAAITGPRGRFMHVRFGLQSALLGNLKEGFADHLTTFLTAWMPSTRGWVRQFIHEDDVTDIVAKISFTDIDWEYDVFNLTPASEPVFAKTMAKAVSKRILNLPPSLIRLTFWFFWHATRGRIPTCSGSWRFYSYPLLMSGKKLASVYNCLYTSREAVTYTNGRYEDQIPKGMRKSK